MLRGVLVPMALTWMVGATTAFAVAYVFTAEAFDRALLDDAHVLATHVVAREGRLTLDLTKRELGAVLLDKSETEFFAVLRSDGSVVASNAALRPAPLEAGKLWEFDDLSYQGVELRMVKLQPQGQRPSSSSWRARRRGAGNCCSVSSRIRSCRRSCCCCGWVGGCAGPSTVN